VVETLIAKSRSKMLPSIYPSDPYLRGAQTYPRCADELVKRIRENGREDVLFGGAMLYEPRVISAINQDYLRRDTEPLMTANVS
jgi:hypothetical protein